LVVAYDGATSLAASRLWWLLTDAGHRRVRVLNGGLAAWQSAGLPTESGAVHPPGTPGTFEARPGQRAQLGAEDILARRTGGPLLVDVRAAERFTGETEPMDPVAGHIPGAINRPSTENLDAAGRFRPPSEIAERFPADGEDLVLYCGSGITAAQSLLALESAGRTAAIYPGSWSDWITDPDRPVATGTD
jgi:thiosulfate/3-mercaptopyruvate sulfurtransferase